MYAFFERYLYFINELSVLSMTIVAFAEKNKAAEQISDILSGGKARKISVRNMPAYSFTWNQNNWIIMGLAGHIMNYDFSRELNDWKGVDPKVLLSTMPQKMISKANYVAAVQELLKDATLLVLACDYDREGENIGFEVKLLADKHKNIPIKRAKYSSFTKKEIEDAFSNLLEPDANIAMAADVRQILDLKMGAAFTRYITMAVQEKVYRKGVLSIGPCQTPTCGFVYEREKKIKDFVPVDFWKITANFNVNGVDFEGTHRKGNIRDESIAYEIYSRICGEEKSIVLEKKITEELRNPPVPFNTNEFLKNASKYLNIGSEVALEIAEQLYLVGYISYPRTETNRYAEEFDFESIVMGFVSVPAYQRTALEILSHQPIQCNNGKNDAHDHPPIHPVMTVSSSDIENSIKIGMAAEVYDLISRHFLSTLMPAAIFNKTRLVMSIRDELFDVAGSVRKVDGWLGIYPYGAQDDKMLPFVDIEQEVNVKNISNTKDKTKPPAKLTEAELLTLMAKNGIGTKATAPTHIQTNKIRGYFEIKKKSIYILDTGYTLMDGLSNSVPIIVKPDIRARIEQLIQDVEDGKKSMAVAIKEGSDLLLVMYFQLELHRDKLVAAIAGTIEEERAEVDRKSVVGTCPECGKELVLKKTDNGRFVGCAGYPACRCSYSLPKTGSILFKKEASCKRKGPAVFFIDHQYYWVLGIGPCFTCEMQKECYPPDIIGDCSKCNGKLVLIHTKTGSFAGCANRCGYSVSFPNGRKVTLSDKTCSICNWHLLHFLHSGVGSWDICLNQKCRNNGTKLNEKMSKTKADKKSL